MASEHGNDGTPSGAASVDEVERELLSSRHADWLEVGPDDADAAAKEVLERLRQDDAWPDASLPTLEQLRASMAKATEVWSDGTHPWLSRLEELIVPALDVAFRGASAAQPVVRVLARDEATADGSMPTPPNLSNARCVPLPGIEEAYLVLIDRGLLRYTSLAVRSLAACLPTDILNRRYEIGELSDFVNRRIEEDPERTVFSFAEATVEIAIAGTPMGAGSFPVTPERLNMTQALFYATDAFLLGHEIAHFELGHHSGPRPLHEALGALHTIDTYWREIQSDELGMSICAHALQRGRIAPMPHVTLGAWIFLTALRAMDLATRVYGASHLDEGLQAFEGYESNNPGPYPTPMKRKQQLYDTLARSMDNPDVLTHLWMSFDVLEGPYLRYTANHADAMRPT